MYSTQEILARCTTYERPKRLQDYQRNLAIIAERGRGVDYTVKPLRLSPFHHQLYFQTRNLLQLENRGSHNTNNTNRPYEFNFDDWVQFRRWNSSAM